MEDKAGRQEEKSTMEEKAGGQEEQSTVVDPALGLEDVASLRQWVLSEHNRHRAENGAGPLQLDDKVGLNWNW